MIDKHICTEANKHEIDLGQGDKKTDNTLGYGIKRKDLNDHPASRFGEGDVIVFMILHSIGNPRDHTVGGECSYCSGEKRVKCDSPPLPPRIESNAKQLSLGTWAKIHKWGIVIEHDDTKNETTQNTP